MTSIVGIYCKDGIVIGTDSSATFAQGRIPTIEQKTEKLAIVGNKVIIAGTGQVGLGQRFVELANEAVSSNLFHNNKTQEICTALAEMTIKDFSRTGVKLEQYGALVGFVAEKDAHLCEFAVTDFQPELKTEKLWFCSMGSGQQITDTILAYLKDIFWNETQPNVNEGVLATHWTLQHAIDTNPGGINGPISIAVLEKDKKFQWKVSQLEDEDLHEHMEQIEEFKNVLRKKKSELSNTSTADLPEPPKPEK